MKRTIRRFMKRTDWIGRVLLSKCEQKINLTLISMAFSIYTRIIDHQLIVPRYDNVFLSDASVDLTTIMLNPVQGKLGRSDDPQVEKVEMGLGFGESRKYSESKNVEKGQHVGLIFKKLSLCAKVLAHQRHALLLSTQWI